jgi:hypothetical protein
MIKFKSFLYQSSKKELLLVYAKEKPSIETMPKSGTWVVREYHYGGWIMPCFPEIVWETLRKFKYIGELVNA